MTLVGLEDKLGIRASDTATLLFESCRVPAENLLGSAEVRNKREKQPVSDGTGFKGAMARLLTWRAASMMNAGRPNSLEASMAKAKAGLAVLGPAGYSQKLLVEKWMRDAKINDIYEGTQQINQLIVARRILNYSSSMLR